MNTFTSFNGVPFSYRIVKRGERYGLDDCLIHLKSEPLIEFYDARYMHTEYGQFITRYSLRTLLDSNSDHGLNLDGGVDDWTLDKETKLKMVDSVMNDIYGTLE